MRHLTLLLSSLALVTACSREATQPAVPTQTTTAPVADSETKKLETMAARFAPVDLTADVSKLPANERQALAKLVEAAKVIDALFLRQVWAGNETMLLDLVRDELAARTRAPALLPDQQGAVVAARSQRGVRRRRAAEARAGQLLSGRRDEGRGRSVDEVAARRRERARATGFFTTIRRGPDGKFIAVPYSARIPGRDRAASAALLREAAALDDAADAQELPREARRGVRSATTTTTATSPGWSSMPASSRRSARTRCYEDEWFNYKAAFEAFITLRDDAETAEAGAVRRPSCRRSRTTCRSIRNTATRSSARWRRSASSTPCSRRATAIAACRPRPSTCRTTSA